VPAPVTNAMLGSPFSAAACCRLAMNSTACKLKRLYLVAALCRNETEDLASLGRAMREAIVCASGLPGGSAASRGLDLCVVRLWIVMVQALSDRVQAVLTHGKSRLFRLRRSANIVPSASGNPFTNK
jgi:hypothetical protein